MTTGRYLAAGDARKRNRNRNPGGSICWHAESRADGLRGASSGLLQAYETLQLNHLLDWLRAGPSAAAGPS